MVGDPMTDFRNRLRELRENAGLTQTQLAERAGLHKHAIVKLERGERKPAWPTLLALASALGVNVGAFAEEPSAPVRERRQGRPRKRSSVAATPKKPSRKRGRSRSESGRTGI
jgi:transcriptional regulator with XRE-family HTH domain